MAHGLKKVMITGQVFGNLVVVSEADPFVLPSGYKQYASLCQCSCGQMTTVRNQSLRSGSTLSCGCLQKRSAKDRATHGHNRRDGKRTSEYNSWATMIARVTNPNNPRWKHYGGGGITVCERWRSFSNFIADMGLKPGKRYSIERIDTHGNYCPENCKWASDSEQANNTTKSKRFTFYGLSKTISEWSMITGVPKGSIWDRLEQSWPLKYAFWSRLGTRKKDIPLAEFCEEVIK